MPSLRRLILRSFQSPGDIVMLTAAVRDLHLANPGRFETDVRTSCDALWEHNPHVTRLSEGSAGVEQLEMHYPLIHESNQRPYHFLHGYPQYLEQQLGLKVPVTRFCGDIHLSPEERQAPPPGAELGILEKFWIVVAGGKYDFTAKWWNPASYQAVVDHFRGKIRFVQCGEAGHWHPPLEGVINLVGKTSPRQFIRLMHHAEGVLCPVTFAMHLAAAVETRPGRPRHRACVVVAGGREPAHWEAYPHHQFLSTVGSLPCCADGGCWKSRCQAVGDGDPKDHHDLCVDAVQVSPELRIPRCMDLITPQQVIERIELYYQGVALQFHSAAAGERISELGGGISDLRNDERSNGASHSVPAMPPDSESPPSEFQIQKSKPLQSKIANPKSKISVSFHHGLGDSAYFAHLIPLYTRRGYAVEVECTPDKRILFEAAGATIISGRAAASHPWAYPAGGTHSDHGRFWQGSKIGHNISEPPLPFIGDKTELWDEYCQSFIDIRPHLSKDSIETVERWLPRLPRPVVLLHTKGNTGQHQKSLPDAIAAEFYKSLLDRFDGSIILLDWDNRVPRLASYRVRHLDELGACSTETMLALMTKADLMVGVDSGPLHAARFTSIPTVGLWMPGHYPATYTLPRPQQLNVVLADHTREWNRFKRIPWNIVEHTGSVFQPDRLAEFCVQMLSPARYFTSPPADGVIQASRPSIASDVQLQQFVREWCRGRTGNALSAFADRHRSLDVLFTEISRRFEAPTIVETGTIRAEEDWGGAGFFTYLAGAYLSRQCGRISPKSEPRDAITEVTNEALPPVTSHGLRKNPPTLHSVDLSPGNCEFARTWTAVFGDTVKVHAQDSVTFLQNFTDSIDVLYLDSLDTTEPGHAEHCQRELEAAWPRLHEQSLVVIDDTPWHGGAWVGKGARAAAWLVDRGWKVLYAGYQVVLAMTERSGAGGQGSNHA